MFRVAVESIFGLSLEQGRPLVIKPAISASWPQCRITYRLPGEATRFEITIENPNGKETGVTQATLDGCGLAIDAGAARAPLSHDGAVHRVEVTL
jgi:cyclic beta-1,2-glucan synthetase